MTTRRNFIKGMVGLVGLSLIGSTSGDTPLYQNEEMAESKLYYSVSGISCRNPCGEIIFAESRKDAEEIALRSGGGIVNYSGTLKGKRVEGNYRIGRTRHINALGEESGITLSFQNLRYI